MSVSDIPFNIELLNLTPEKLKGIRPVTSLDIYDETKRNFHEDGLYSAAIFGRIGDQIRDYRFSYIDIKVGIFHPILFKSILKLKSLYGEILSGKTFAIWNDEIKDFEKSTALDGDTGYHFFVQHWEELDYKRTQSDLRDQYIKLIDKYKPIALTSKIVVLPAGLRELEFNDNGRQEENEINPLYRKLLSISNVINEATIKENPRIINSARYSLQITFNQIYDVFNKIIEGKKKLILGKWASRKVFNGTRNVITSMNTSVPYLGDPNNITFNSCEISLFQYIKAILPITKYQLKSGFLSKIFMSRDLPVRLINKNTLKVEDVKLPSNYFDYWYSDDGLDKVIESFREESIRHNPITIGNHYLGLIYKGPDNTFKLFQDLEELPTDRKQSDVSPITLCELIYCSIYGVTNRYPGFITRYPIADLGSIHPTYPHVKTTTKSEIRRELNDLWEIDESKSPANEFPIPNVPFMNTLVPHASRLARLNADFDGDVCSFTAVYSDTAVKEIEEFFNDRRAYLDSVGKIMHSTNIDTVAYVLHNLTGP